MLFKCIEKYSLPPTPKKRNMTNKNKYEMKGKFESLLQVWKRTFFQNKCIFLVF